MSFALPACTDAHARKNARARKRGNAEAEKCGSTERQKRK